MKVKKKPREGWRKKIVGKLFLTLFFLAPLERTLNYSGLSLFVIVAGVYGVALLVTYKPIVIFENFFRAPSYLLPLLTLAFYSLLSSYWSLNPLSSFVFGVKIGAIFLFLITLPVSQLADMKVYQPMGAFILGGLVGALILLVSWAIGMPRGELIIQQNPNWLAAPVLIAMVFSILMLRRSVLWLPVVAIFAISLLVSGSRLATVLAILSIAVILVRRIARALMTGNGYQFLLTLGLLPIGFAVILSFMDSRVIELVSDFTSVHENIRIEIAKLYIDTWGEKPLLGWGAGVTWEATALAPPMSLSPDDGQGVFYSPHNVFISLGVGSGILGLLLFLMTFAGFFYRIPSLYNKVLPQEVGFFLILAVAATLGIWLTTNNIFAKYPYLILALAQIATASKGVVKPQRTGAGRINTS